MPYSTEVEAEIFEPMESYTPVRTCTGDQSFHVRLDGQVRIASGDRMAIGFDIRRGSKFDKKAEART